MNWIMWVGVGLVVLLLIVLIMPSGKNKGSSPDPNKPMTTDEMSELQRAMWAQTEEALIVFRDARGDGVGPARERLLGVVDDVDARVRALAGEDVPERTVDMFQLAVEEIREFVNDALTRHPEDQQR